MAEPGLVEEYLTLGLRLGRHIDGMVDAYYGPAGRAASVEAEPLVAPDRLVADSRSLLASIDAGSPLETASPSGGGAEDGAAPSRRHWLRAQVVGLLTTARKLAGEQIGYADEVEACYGVRPTRVDEEVLVAAHRRLEEVLPGSDPLAERLVAWRESHAVPVDKLRPAIDSLAEDLRHRTKTLFGLPDGEHVEFDLVTGQPWSGFNYYLGDLHSRVAVNTDLPVLEWYRNRWGGGIYRKKDTIERRPQWVWQLHEGRLLAFLEDIAPHQKIKGPATENAIAFLRLKLARRKYSKVTPEEQARLLPFLKAHQALNLDLRPDRRGRRRKVA